MTKTCQCNTCHDIVLHAASPYSVSKLCIAQSTSIKNKNSSNTPSSMTQSLIKHLRTLPFSHTKSVEFAFSKLSTLLQSLRDLRIHFAHFPDMKGALFTLFCRFEDALPQPSTLNLAQLCDLTDVMAAIPSSRLFSLTVEQLSSQQNMQFSERDTSESELVLDMTKSVKGAKKQNNNALVSSKQKPKSLPLSSLPTSTKASSGISQSPAAPPLPLLPTPCPPYPSPLSSNLPVSPLSPFFLDPFIQQITPDALNPFLPPSNVAHQTSTKGGNKKAQPTTATVSLGGARFFKSIDPNYFVFPSIIENEHSSVSTNQENKSGTKTALISAMALFSQEAISSFNSSAQLFMHLLSPLTMIFSSSLSSPVVNSSERVTNLANYDHPHCVDAQALALFPEELQLKQVQRESVLSLWSIAPPKSSKAIVLRHLLTYRGLQDTLPLLLERGMVVQLLNNLNLIKKRELLPMDPAFFLRVASPHSSTLVKKSAKHREPLPDVSLSSPLVPAVSPPPSATLFASALIHKLITHSHQPQALIFVAVRLGANINLPSPYWCIRASIPSTPSSTLVTPLFVAADNIDPLLVINLLQLGANPYHRLVADIPSNGNLNSNIFEAFQTVGSATLVQSHEKREASSSLASKWTQQTVNELNMIGLGGILNKGQGLFHVLISKSVTADPSFSVVCNILSWMTHQCDTQSELDDLEFLLFCSRTEEAHDPFRAVAKGAPKIKISNYVDEIIAKRRQEIGGTWKSLRRQIQTTQSNHQHFNGISKTLSALNFPKVNGNGPKNSLGPIVNALMDFDYSKSAAGKKQKKNR
eukprot:GDKJ01007744.1.p1 GENE.GDKJ01007744.1~~GDKJ01007744.1.p1  ORF type:complete len:834 (-),score=226.16 GDKJ01007744.1:113-2542(-)